MSILSSVLFTFFAGVAIAAALGVVLLRNAIHSALALVGVMTALAGIFLLMNAELVAAIQIIVYAGAIVVLFLFVIMMLNLREPEETPRRNWPVRVIGALFSLVLLAQMGFAGLMLIGRQAAAPEGTAAVSANAGFAHLGGQMMTQYALPFELVSILLLAAIIGAIVVSRRPTPDEEEN